MLQDNNAFLDPYGGRPTSNPLVESPFAIGAAFAIEGGLFSKYVVNPLEREHRRGLTNKLMSKRFDQVTMNQVTWAKPIGPRPYRSVQGMGPSSSEQAKFLHNYSDGYDRTNKYLIAKHKQAAPVYKNLRRNLRGFGLLTLAAGMADLGSYMARPGIRQAAIASDQRAMETTMLDTGVAFTQRQRAVQAIYDSQSSIRNVIGSEAQYFHR